MKDKEILNLLGNITKIKPNTIIGYIHRDPNIIGLLEEPTFSQLSVFFNDYMAKILAEDNLIISPSIKPLIYKNDEIIAKLIMRYISLSIAKTGEDIRLIQDMAYICHASDDGKVFGFITDRKLRERLFIATVKLKGTKCFIKSLDRPSWRECIFSAKYEDESLPFVMDYVDKTKGKFRLEKLVNDAVSSSPLNIRFIKNPSEKLKDICIKQRPLLIKYFDNQTTEDCLKAINSNIYAFKFILPENRTHEILDIAIKNGNNKFWESILNICVLKDYQFKEDEIDYIIQKIETAFILNILKLLVSLNYLPASESAVKILDLKLLAEKGEN